LAKIASLVKEQRVEAPKLLLLDCGDTTQGTPLAYYFAVKDLKAKNPTIAAFNEMHYDAMAVGNHEFNFGLAEMWKAKRESNFPWLAANLKEIYTAGNGFIRPYIIKNVGGVRIGIVGFVTPGVPRWEIPEHYRGYEFEPIVEAARRVIPLVRKQVDLLVVIMHSGLDRDPATGKIFEGQDIRGENAAWELAHGERSTFALANTRFTDSEGKERPGDISCPAGLWTAESGADGIDLRSPPAPRRALGDCRSDRKGWTHPNGAGSRLGEAGRR
jgi:2',3'-cyclic-nucleotide 2'-phosphodiesterase/3'-nucleotidase